MSKTMPSTMTTLQQPVVLVGMMGAGKTAIGGAIARHLGVSFIDSDDALEAAANMTIAEIFERDGEAFFRKREAEVIDRLLGGRPAILATGGGAFLQPTVRASIAERAVSVWLKADLDLLWSRVRHKTTRPLLCTDNPYATLRALCETREPVYALADHTVEAQRSYSIDDMAGRVIDALSKAGLITEGAT